MKEKVIVKFKRTDPEAILPKYHREGDACFDFHALIKEKYNFSDDYNSVVIHPLQQKVIRTGWALQIPKGYEMQVRPKSGKARHKQLTITNSPGTVDSGYKEEIEVILFNLGKSPVIIKDKERICQCKISEIPEVEIVEVEEFDKDRLDRGGGFGSTGDS